MLDILLGLGFFAFILTGRYEFFPLIFFVIFALQYVFGDEALSDIPDGDKED